MQKGKVQAMFLCTNISEESGTITMPMLSRIFFFFFFLQPIFVTLFTLPGITTFRACSNAICNTPFIGDAKWGILSVHSSKPCYMLTHNTQKFKQKSGLYYTQKKERQLIKAAGDIYRYCLNTTLGMITTKMHILQTHSLKNVYHAPTLDQPKRPHMHTCLCPTRSSADDKFILEAAVTHYEHSFTMQAKWWALEQ